MNKINTNKPFAEGFVRDAFLKNPGWEHFFPNRKTIGLNYHTATHGRILSKIGLNYNVIIPLRKVVFSSGKISGHNFLAWCLCRVNRS